MPGASCLVELDHSFRGQCCAPTINYFLCGEVHCQSFSQVQLVPSEACSRFCWDLEFLYSVMNSVRPCRFISLPHIVPVCCALVDDYNTFLVKQGTSLQKDSSKLSGPWNDEFTNPLAHRRERDSRGIKEFRESRHTH